MFEDNDSLEKLKKQLYSRKGIKETEVQNRSRSTFSRSDHKDDWEYNNEPIPQKPAKKEILTKQIQKKEGRHQFLFVSISLGILLLSSALVAYKLFFSGTLVSPKNVTIEIDGPATARAGDKVNLDVSVENTNKVDLLNAKLIAEFPENTLSADDSGEKVVKVERPLGVIPAGGVVTEEFDVLLFGQENENLPISFSLEYSTESSSALLSNEEVHTVRISTAPVTLRVAPSLREVQSGNQFEIEIDVRSNTATPLENVLVQVEYPNGFNFVSSNPAPISEGNIWRIGTLDTQESKSITIRGYLEGQNNEDRFFRVNVGQESGENDSIGRLFASNQEKVKITAPQIALATEINKSLSKTVSSLAGERVMVKIDWSNTLRNPLTNMIIEAKVDDDYIKENSIQATGGFYQSSNRTIKWDRTTTPALGSIDTFGRGSVVFSFTIADSNKLSGAQNPEIPIKITARASEPQGGDNTRSIENSIDRTVRIASNLIVGQTFVTGGGTFVNTGPNPPESERETTYTVQWTVGNSGNDVKNTSVRAALPSYVTFVSAGDDSSVKFSALTNEVIWNIGEISEGTTSVSNLKTSFQISFIPSRSQIGKTPILIYDAEVEGRDSFTGSILRGRSSALQSLKVIE